MYDVRTFMLWNSTPTSYSRHCFSNCNS